MRNEFTDREQKEEMNMSTERTAKQIVDKVIYKSETSDSEREKAVEDFIERYGFEDVKRKDIVSSVTEEIERIEDEEFSDVFEFWFDDEEVRTEVVDAVVEILSENL